MFEDEDDDLPQPTKEESKEIKAIDKDTVHRICSGQVVLNLAIAVKELVENSLDAGATIIEVKLKDHGLTSVEVVDNGSGVNEENFIGIAAKHYTSKIKEFDDLQSIETFGFRGEALSSLCALCDMTIVTRHRTTDVGTKLQLDKEGNITTKTPCPRQVGTTITLMNLFHTLPVRKREFMKNVKKEFAKMCQILQGYCLAAKGVRIICTNMMTDKNSRQTILSTDGSQSVLDNIRSIFGAKQLAEIVEIEKINNKEETHQLVEDILDDLNESNVNCTLEKDEIEESLRIFKLEGWISSCAHGGGRSSRDRQFFFVNSRPCDPKNVMKLVNEIYHQYNNLQNPFVFLNIITKQCDVDVNLTPDKRQLLLRNEKILLSFLKKSLHSTFKFIPSTYKMQCKIIDSAPKQENETVAPDSDDDVVLISSTQKFAEALSQWKMTGDTSNGSKIACKRKRSVEKTETVNSTVGGIKSQKITEILPRLYTQISKSGEERFMSYKSSDEDEDNESTLNNSTGSCNISITKNANEIQTQSRAFDNIFNDEFENKNKIISSQSSHSTTMNIDEDEILTDEKSITENVITCKNVESKSASKMLIVEEIDRIENGDMDQDLSQRTTSTETFIDSPSPSVSSSRIDIETKLKRINNEDDISSENASEREIILDSESEDDQIMYDIPTSQREAITATIDEIRRLVIEEKDALNTLKNKESENVDKLKFKSQIIPKDNKNAEEELQREIGKDSFVKMEIIGQFNLGFIIVNLDDDLFIIDQHAANEKYNFETLQKSTTLETQPLTIPQTLELTAVSEMILIDNLKVFEANGFKFEINENAPVTRRVKLLSKPFSKNWSFGKDDIEELIFMLQDAPPDTICRPSRIRDMFASRACRKSVMIGTALNKSTMKKLVQQMGEIDQPWNCPHGRPTMRHLINLKMFKDEIN